jgi:hypothetical protein
MIRIACTAPALENPARVRPDLAIRMTAWSTICSSAWIKMRESRSSPCSADQTHWLYTAPESPAANGWADTSSVRRARYLRALRATDRAIGKLLRYPEAAREARERPAAWVQYLERFYLRLGVTR